MPEVKKKNWWEKIVSPPPKEAIPSWLKTIGGIGFMPSAAQEGFLSKLKQGKLGRAITEEELRKLSGYEQYVRAALPLQDLEAAYGELNIPIAVGFTGKEQEEVRYGIYKTGAATLAQSFITKPGEKVDWKGLTEGGEARRRYEERVHPLLKGVLEYALFFGAQTAAAYGGQKIGELVIKDFESAYNKKVNVAFDRWWQRQAESKMSIEYGDELRSDLRSAFGLVVSKDAATQAAGSQLLKRVNDQLAKGYYGAVAPTEAGQPPQPVSVEPRQVPQWAESPMSAAAGQTVPLATMQRVGAMELKGQQPQPVVSQPEQAVMPQQVAGTPVTPEVTIKKGDKITIVNPTPINIKLKGKQIEVYSVRGISGKIAGHFTNPVDIKRWTGKNFIFDKSEFQPVIPKAMSITPEAVLMPQQVAGTPEVQRKVQLQDEFIQELAGKLNRLPRDKWQEFLDWAISSRIRDAQEIQTIKTRAIEMAQVMPQSVAGMPEAGVQTDIFGNLTPVTPTVAPGLARQPVEPVTSPLIPAEGVVPPVKPPTAEMAMPQPTVTAQMTQMYAGVQDEINAMKAGLRGLKGKDAFVARQTLKRLQSELTSIDKTLKGFDSTREPTAMKLRQNIMALTSYKGFSKTQLREIIKKVTGKSSLMAVPEAQLTSVLEAVQRTRPARIQGKTVIKTDTERDIQSLKQALFNEGSLDKDSYKVILEYAKLRTDRYESADRYITESDGRNFIRILNKEGRLGYAQKQATIKKALSSNPKIVDGISNLKPRIGDMKIGIADHKKVNVNPNLDMRYYIGKLQITTGEPFYDIWYMALEKKWELSAQTKQIKDALETSIPDFAQIAQDEEALARINQYIASKNIAMGIESPANITPSEMKLADAIEKTLYGFRNDVRFYRFLRSYNRSDGDSQLINNEIPNAPKEDIREAIKILESQGDKALRTYTDTKTWGVIQSGYEPEVAVNPKLMEHRVKAAVLGAGHLNTREEVAFDKQDRNILQRTNSYVKQVLNLQLEPYLQKLDEMYGASVDKMNNPRGVKRNLELAMNGLKGYGEDVGELGRVVRNIGSQLLRVRFLLPDKAFRNSLQNLAFHPDREAFINPSNRRLTESEMADFENKIASVEAFAQDYLMRNAGLGHKGINRVLDKISLFPLSERLNRLTSYWASINKAERAIKAYTRDGDVGKYTTASGLNDLTALQQKQGLELLATDQKEAVAFIAREITNNTHMVYTKAEKAPIQMGAVGETLGSLMTFPRSYVQRMALQWQKLLGKNVPFHERNRAFKNIVGVIVFGMLSGVIYKAVTGKDKDPYNPIDIISWTPGGVAVGATTQVTDLLYTINQALMGDEEALMRIPTKLTQAGDAFIPFYEPVINGLESLTSQQQVDRRVLREIISMLKKDYHPNQEYYRKEREFIESLQHIVFGAESKPVSKTVKTAPSWLTD